LWLPGASHAGGTQSSNPLCSSGESIANLTSCCICGSRRARPCNSNSLVPLARTLPHELRLPIHLYEMDRHYKSVKKRAGPSERSALSTSTIIIRLTPSETGRVQRPTGKTARTDRERDGRRYAETRPLTPPTVARDCRRQCPRYRARFHSGAAARQSQGRADRGCPSSNRCARSIVPHLLQIQPTPPFDTMYDCRWKKPISVS
jgi:hypothetical protein